MDSASLVVSLVAVAVSLAALGTVIAVNSGLEGSLFSLEGRIGSLQQGLDRGAGFYAHPAVDNPPLRPRVPPPPCNGRAVTSGAPAAVSGAVSPVPGNGLVAEWVFDNPVPDASGNGNNGIQCGGLVFDGNGSYVAVPDSPSLAMAYGNTVDLWVKVAAYPPNYAMLVNKWANGEEDKQLGIDSAGRVHYYLFNTFSRTPLVSSSVLLPGRWYNIAGTYDNTTARIYVNGILDASKPASGAVGNSNGRLFFGYNPDRAMSERWFSPFDGVLGGMSIYDRALSGKEIGQLYAGAAAGIASLGRYPWGEAYDNGTGEIFVTNYGSNTVSVISDRNDTVLDTVPVGGAAVGTVHLPAETGLGGSGYIPGTVQPQGMAYDRATGEVFVGEYRLGQVQAISDEDNAIVATIGVGDEPQDMAYDPARGEIFVADYGPYPVGSYAGPFHVSVVSDKTGTVVDTVTVGTSPFGIAYDPKMGEIFVTNAESNSISVINDVTDRVVSTIPLGNPMSAAYDSATGQVFVTSAASGTVSAISDSSGKVTATIPVGRAPLGIAYDRARGEVFVTDSESNAISVISDRNDTVVDTIR